MEGIEILMKEALEKGEIFRCLSKDKEIECEVWKEKGGGIARNNYRIYFDGKFRFIGRSFRLLENEFKKINDKYDLRQIKK